MFFLFFFVLLRFKVCHQSRFAVEKLAESASWLKSWPPIHQIRLFEGQQQTSRANMNQPPQEEETPVQMA